MVASTLAKIGEIRRAQRADGPAAMLGIGTANPTNYVLQEEFPDYYFRVTNKEHLTDLKDTFKKLCRIAGLEKRFFHHTEQLLNANPAFLHGTPSALDARLDIVAKAAPELAASAAAKAIARWGRPATDITHLIVSTNSEARSPGADLGLATLLGLRPDVCRTVLQLDGCSAGCTALRLAKDHAENNRGARVLVVCVELTITTFRAPHEGDSFGTLIPQALFGDGAGAVIVGSDAVHPAERPLFEMVSASQAMIPGSEKQLNVRLGEGGVDIDISFNLPRFVAQNLERCLLDASGALGVEWKWNDLFWAVHPGSRGILDRVESALGLEPRKLASSRTVVRDYGNMLSATVIFVLEELRRRMDEEGDEAAEWGMMVGFGPGFTVETMVLHATKY
ncbi:bisdemethoxycurcumin synthase-like [Panicum miliaceum]|uniref:Bisdemethoxycurcumin synthase-like n=1 Tax=Panicum miliaceum TaxID=4540 RepID=A0A3L6PC12_PANMI|nr:bisdemethoxycurcumin synthase-like [Panicum miliaceum]RLN34723.1 bisdemethoxycurcumin synthase-like [Panicum miliaceum]